MFFFNFSYFDASVHNVCLVHIPTFSHNQKSLTSHKNLTLPGRLPRAEHFDRVFDEKFCLEFFASSRCELKVLSDESYCCSLISRFYVNTLGHLPDSWHNPTRPIRSCGTFNSIFCGEIQDTVAPYHVVGWAHMHPLKHLITSA